MLLHQQLKNNHETLGLLAAFIVLEPNSYQKPFGHIVEQLLSQITLKQYVVQLTEKGEVTGYALWAKLDTWTETVYQSGLRPLHMLEYNSGSKFHVTNIGVSESGNIIELRNWLESNLK
jgi:hemolysin-activating ACP:hemolysin acyltransferase